VIRRDAGEATTPAPALLRPDLLPPGELPPGYASGHRVTLPRIEMPVYLAWLEGRFLAGGGALEPRALRSLDEALAASPLVVNCSGLGARELAGDPSMHPIRGQVVRVENPGIERFWLDESEGEVTYVIPRTRDVVLGGTAEEGARELAPDPEVARRIVERCAALEPRLAGARVLGHAVGLRPGRPAVRLERQLLAGGARCIHNYGHGGSGVTISWGCADEVVALARS
jgi:D-amino-acid oxidase